MLTEETGPAVSKEYLAEILLPSNPLLVDFDTLPEDVIEELTDERFFGRKHYSRSTYAMKCRGPLCRKAERDRGRDRWVSQRAKVGQSVSPRPAARVEDDDARLEPIVIWYLENRKEIREGRKIA